MRKTYKFSHSVSQGGYLYAQKIKDDIPIENKEGLRNAISAISTKLELIDVTIKIYDNIFFVFFTTKPRVSPQEVISKIQANIGLFGSWDEEYIFTGVYDLQEEYVRKDLEKMGFDYGKG